MNISQRTLHLGTENSFSILRQVEDLRSRGKDIVNFCIGQPDFDTPDNIKHRAIQAIDEGKRLVVQQVVKLRDDWLMNIINLEIPYGGLIEYEFDGNLNLKNKRIV